MTDTEYVLKIEDLSVSIINGKKEIPILRNISFTVHKGERWAIAGESGAGKSMTMNALTALLPEKGTKITGRILFKNGTQDVDLLQIPYKERHALAAEHTAVIFQDAINALNPNERIRKQWGQTAALHRSGRSKKEMTEYLLRRMEIFGIKGGEGTLNQFPGQLSGGMRQRIAIAMALESKAEILIADEPTTSLDAITQRSTIEFIKTLLDNSERTLLFISHNLGILQYMCDHVMILKDGRVVEQGTAQDVFFHPAEPYTRELVRETIAIMGKEADASDEA